MPRSLAARPQIPGTRLVGAVQRGDTIYTSNNTKSVASSSPNPYANAQWYEVPVSDGAAITHGVANSSVAYFYPSVTPGGLSATSFVGWEVSDSSSTQSASAYRGRDSTIPAIYAGLGVSGYKLNSRRGDCAASALDPVDGSVWVFGEYVASSAAWRTAVESVTASSPPQKSVSS